MGLLNDIFQQQQQISQNPTSVVRTPQQVAYDNMLNREYEINQQNKTNNFVSGLMSGIGGLGKVIANSVVSNPYQKAGAMEGIGEQETRLDSLRQAYDQARQQQNKDFVAQAREQLGLAREDEDKNWNRDFAQEKMDWDKFVNNRNFENIVRQQDINNKWREIEDTNKREAIEQAKIQAEQDAKRQDANDILDRAYKQAQIDKLNRENSPEYIKQQQEQALKQEQDKQRQKQLETYVGTAKDLFNKGLLSNEDMIAIEKNPELAESLIPAKARIPLAKIPLFWDSSRRLKIDKKAKQDFQILKDANGNMAKVYKDGRIEEL